MQRAFEIYPYCSMALNSLANHFFFTGQHFLVEQLTETALAVANHGPMKSHAYYNLARSYHSKVWNMIFFFFYFCICAGVHVCYLCCCWLPKKLDETFLPTAWITKQKIKGRNPSKTI